MAMKAVVVYGLGDWQIAEIPAPVAGPFDCLVKIDACAVCTGTDSDLVYGHFPWRSPYPFVLGHESTGLIVEKGAGVRHFQVGQRVTRPAGPLAGETIAGIGSNWGGYAGWGLVRDVQAAREAGVEASGMHASSRVPVPAGVDPVSAALSINQREILSVTRRISFEAGSRVAVLGSGYNGLLFSLFCKHYGAGQVAVLGNPAFRERGLGRFQAGSFIDYKTPRAAGLVCRALGGSPTHVIDAVGSLASLDLAGELLAPETAFGCYGVRDFNDSAGLRESLAKTHPTLDMGTDEAGCMDEWHALWLEGFFAQPGMVDAVMPLVEIKIAFEILARREAVKIVLAMEA
jgi:threonine dehydrogenase-like Zn-dependent dehydrogenase